MSQLSVLVIGGNGIIGHAASQVAVEKGYEVTHLSRGIDTTRPEVEGVTRLVGDSSDAESIRSAIGAKQFDVVVNLKAFVPEQVLSDITTFTGRTGHYLFTSSASAYAKPVTKLPITESSALRNPSWDYSANKIACEEILTAAYRADAFPATIIRPAHTYDRTLIPLAGEWTAIDRMRRGKKTVVHGDGTSFWTLTHARDFAVAFVGLLGNPRAHGEVFQITSDEATTWDAITQVLATAAGTTADIVHVSSDDLAREVPAWGPGLVGDKAHNLIFDNSKVKALVPEFVATTPFWQGAQEIIDWYDASPARRVVDAALDAQLDAVVARHS